MSTTVTHPRCGKSWVQRGNRTGHCAKCHETFEGIAIFDAHQRINDDGSVRCLPPAEVGTGSKRKGTWEALRLVNGTWRGPAAPDGLWDKS
jgi:hypothetical protein